MSLKHGLLGLLNYGGMTGYDLSKTFKESLAFFWKAQTSQIYRELNLMEKEGFLTSTIEFQTDKPNRRVYTITEQGRAELKNWLNDYTASSLTGTKSIFLMKMFFSGNRDITSNIHSLRAHKDECENALKKMTPVDNSIQNYGEKVAGNINMLYWGMTAEFGRAYFQMCVQWAEQCIKSLEELEKSGIDQ